MRISSTKGSFRKLTWISGPKNSDLYRFYVFKNEPTTDRRSEQAGLIIVSDHSLFVIRYVTFFTQDCNISLVHQQYIGKTTQVVFLLLKLK